MYNCDPTNHPAVYLPLAILGSIAGVLSQRARASGVTALVLAIAPGLALWEAFGRS